jgi:toxin ParE1/3/4
LTIELPIIWAEEARQDLLALGRWIARDGDTATAAHYSRAIIAHAERLTAFPRCGSSRDDLAPGLRSIVYRRRTIIIYRASETAIEIIHIAHGGRDVARLFADDD